MQPEVQFSKVASRTAASIVLLTVLLGGMVTRTGLCALMCQRRSRAESQRHCVQPTDTMRGMAQGHSAMNHTAVEDMNFVMVSQSCQTNCATAERLNVSRKVVPQVTVVQSGVVVLETTAKLVSPDAAGAWSSDSGPPTPPAAYSASFSILRI